MATVPQYNGTINPAATNEACAGFHSTGTGLAYVAGL